MSDLMFMGLWAAIVLVGGIGLISWVFHEEWLPRAKAIVKREKWETWEEHIAEVQRLNQEVATPLGWQMMASEDFKGQMQIHVRRLDYRAGITMAVAEGGRILSLTDAIWSRSAYEPNSGPANRAAAIRFIVTDGGKDD